MKKFLALLLALAMTLSLVACGGNNNAANDGDDANANTDGDKVYKVAMICDSSISDGGWGAACYNAMVAAAEKMGWETEYTDSISQDQYYDSIVAYCALGYDMIYAPGNQYTDAVLQAAEEYPDVAFALLNGAEKTPGEAVNGNVSSLLPVPYANSFSDAPKGKEFATELISQGADVFFGDASAVDSGAREAIDDANTAAGSIKIYDIGQPADILGQNPCIICSQVTDNSAMIVASMEAVEAGTFGGNTVYGTLENKTLSAGAINTDLVPAEIVEKYNAYLQQMMDGTFMK